MFGENETNFPQGAPNPDKLNCGIDLFLGDYYSDQSDSITAICKLLDRPVSYTTSDGFENEVVGGAATEDQRRLAWVECRSKDVGQYWDVEFRLKATVDGEPTIDWAVETYNPYFGCHVGYLAWWGEQVVMVYREKHDTIVCSVSLDGDVRLLPIDDRWTLAGDVVFSEGDEPDLIETCAIPNVERLLPLPTSWIRQLDSDKLPNAKQLQVPTDREAFWEGLRTRLFGDEPSLPAADLILGSLAYRFVDDWPPVTSTYRRGNNRRWNSPRWLPYYWSEMLPDDDRPVFLELLRELAEQEVTQFRPDWPPDQCAIEAAAKYIVDRVPDLIEACRARELPGNCYFWVNWSQSGFAETLDLFPWGFREAYSQLVPHKHHWSR